MSIKGTIVVAQVDGLDEFGVRFPDEGIEMELVLGKCGDPRIVTR